MLQVPFTSLPPPIENKYQRYNFANIPPETALLFTSKQNAHCCRVAWINWLRRRGEATIGRIIMREHAMKNGPIYSVRLDCARKSDSELPLPSSQGDVISPPK